MSPPASASPSLIWSSASRAPELGVPSQAISTRPGAAKRYEPAFRSDPRNKLIDIVPSAPNSKVSRGSPSIGAQGPTSDAPCSPLDMSFMVPPFLHFRRVALATDLLSSTQLVVAHAIGENGGPKS